MHILYIYTEISIKGGTDKVLVEKANYLINHGYKVTIITETQKNRPVSFKLDSRIRHIDMGLDFNKQYSLPTIKRLILYLSLMREYKKRLRETIAELKPDIIITSMGRSLSLLSKIHFNSKKIGEAHTTKDHLRSLHLLEQRGGLFLIVAKYMRWKMCRCAQKLDALILLTEKDAEDWQGISHKYVIPNPISFYPKEPAKLDNKQVIMVGRFNDAKGYDYLIPAWEKVHQRHPDWILNVYGSGELHDNVEKWIKEHNLENSILLHDPVDNIMDKYLESSICVISSRYEGFSLVIVESMSCGVPVVSFDCPYGPRSIIKNGEDGFLVDYLNIDALSEGICTMIEDYNLRKKMGTTARNNVLRFSKDTVMRNWIVLFDNLVNHENN